MAKENLLYQGLFLSLFGFLVFMLSILNKVNSFFWVLGDYFVIFLFIGIILSAIGILTMIGYSVENRSPFVEATNKGPSLHFAPYLGVGLLFIFTGFILIFYYKGITRSLYIISMAISISGIILLIQGLWFFIKEAFGNKPASH
jgi:hypothetical protein